MRNEEDNSLRNVLTAIIFALANLTGSIGWSDLHNTEYSPKLLELIAEARTQCAEAGGELTVDPEAVTKIDITGSGKSDEILSYSALTCSDNNFMFAGGTGGVWYSWIINENHGKFLTRGWSVDYSKSGYPMLSLSLHGTSCGGVGTTPCEKSYVWNTNTSKLEEVASAAHAKFVELKKEMPLTIKAFGCETERCREHQNCLLDGELKRCLYGSGSAITGGVTFESGQFFYIEWLTEHWDSKGELIKNKQDRYFALVNEKKSLFKDGEDCLTFMSENGEVIFGYGGNCSP
jgi:hypothetical protein